MGNTLSCCLGTNPSPRQGLSWGSAELYCGSDIYEAVASRGAAVAPHPTAVESAQSDFGAQEGHDLQHIGDQEMPKGKEATDTVCPQARLWLPSASRVYTILLPQPPE
uniref:Uncharacterized protein n=1 Tax=Piliocolobus tephrosceles TaxID=591936 RepID=A0A8C9HH00_9PRIM